MMSVGDFKAAAAAAQAAETALRDSLTALRVPERDLGQLRSRVLVDGKGVVTIGSWSAETTEKVAAALEMAVALMRIPEDT